MTIPTSSRRTGADAGRGPASMLAWLPTDEERRAQIDERTEWELRGTLTDRLTRDGPIAELAHVVLALVLLALLWGRVPDAVPLIWCGAIIASAVARHAVRRRVHRRAASQEKRLRAVRLSILVLTLAWGLGALVFAPHLTFVQIALALVIFAGLSASAPLTLASDPPSFFIFLGGLMVPMAVGVLRVADTREHVVAVGLIVLFSATVALLYRRHHRELLGAIRAAKRLEFSEEEIARERGFLVALIASAPTPIATVSRSGKVLGVNPSFERLFGYAAADVMGRGLNDLIVPEEERQRAAALDQRVRAGETVRAETVRRNRAGDHLDVRLAAGPVAGGLQGATFVLYDDVTAVKRAERALQEAEAEYRLLVESATDLVWRVDRGGRWTFLNAASESIYGLPPEGLLGRPFVERVHPDHCDSDLRAFQRVLEGATLSDHETAHLDVLGTRRALSFSARPDRDASNRIVGAHGTARDVTERVEVREALRRARDAAERAAAMKSSFLANMSHEIRTPLNGVMGMLELLLGSPLDAEQERAATLARDSATALLTIIDDILDYSKIEAGHLELDEAPFDLADLVDGAVRLFTSRAVERRIELTAAVDPAVRHTVDGDPLRLRQVLHNLVSNAVKFTHRGSVTLLAEPAAAPPGQIGVRFAVRDTGIGIPPNKLERIFEEFAQADASTTRKYGGTGLGLAISRRLVGLMGGQLAVRSVVHEGSEFYFTLLFRHASAGTTAPVAAAAPRAAGDAGPRRVLLAEDNPVNEAVARAMLEKRGHTVVAVTTGTEAVRAVAEGGPFDVVLMDIQMPEMDGIAATRAVRAGTVGHDVRIIALTAHVFASERDRCLEAGMDGYLAKPFHADDLYAVVEGAAPAAPDPPPGQVPVDLEALRRAFGGAGGADAFAEVTQLYVRDARDRMRTLEQAVRSGSAAAMREAAHAFRSGAGTIGASHLEAALAELERAAAAGNAGQAADLAASVVDAHAAVLEWLAAEGAVPSPPDGPAG